MSSSNQKPFVQPGEPLQDFLRSFWQRQVDAAEQETPDYRHPPLPLARIKKVMKSDPEVKVSCAARSAIGHPKQYVMLTSEPADDRRRWYVQPRIAIGGSAMCLTTV